MVSGRTRGTQNPVELTPREGSIPSSGIAAKPPFPHDLRPLTAPALSSPIRPEISATTPKITPNRPLQCHCRNAASTSASVWML